MKRELPESTTRWKLAALALAASTGLATTADAAPPAVTNLTATVRSGTNLVDISFDVADADSDELDITVKVTIDGGGNYSVPANSLTAGTNPGYPKITFGAGETQKTGVQIVWDAGTDWAGNFSDSTQVRVTADDQSDPPPAPEGMALIPAGSFMMGVEGGNITQVPVHGVFISDFYLDKTEVSKALWEEVYNWAITNGYEFGNAGMGVADDHPIGNIDWYDAVKWCNARSEMEGLDPVYFVDGSRTTEAVYRTGKLDLYPSDVNWDGNGYRLPTESEWEKAARGGLEGKLFPWGDEVTGADCNFVESGDPFEGADIATTPVGYYNGSQVPAGPDRANGYGLYDMAGNVWEWCWDWYDDLSFQDPGATLPDTRGLPQGTNGKVLTDRVMHSGSWNYAAIDSAIGIRLCPRADKESPIYGLRTARSTGIQNFALSPAFALETGGAAPAPFKIVSITRTTTDVIVEWNSETGGLYDVEYSTTPENTESWQAVLPQPIAATTATTSFADGDLSRLNARAIFYRIVRR
ncbi:MAG: SUMF1/EgtB/PvdO family nonheme iron enzyme [Verrucomicrobiales bacterium]